MNDQYSDLPITTIAPRCAKAVHGFAHELLSHGRDCGVIFGAVQADPDSPLAQAYAAALFLTQMTREGRIQAGPRLAAAQALAAYGDERERATIDAVAAWHAGADRTAAAIFRGIVETWPYDLVAAKFCQILQLGIGDRQGMIRTSAMAASVEDRSGYALGLHAFALDQNGDPELALRFARRAIDLGPGIDPWAQHAVAHALSALDQPVEARAFLRSHSAEWDRCSSFMLTHNWWHLGLLALELDDEPGALDIYSTRVWGVRKTHCQDQINAISLLARLEMRGLDVAGHWEDVGAHVEERASDRVNTFLDLHYLYALARSGRDAAADRLAETIAADGETHTAAAVAMGLKAHARGQYFSAASAIGPDRMRLDDLGGSNVQRQFFAAIYRDSLARSRIAGGDGASAMDPGVSAEPARACA
jgi:tetratricopeptide (TPR) repeat protein